MGKMQKNLATRLNDVRKDGITSGATAMAYCAFVAEDNVLKMHIEDEELVGKIIKEMDDERARIWDETHQNKDHDEAAEVLVWHAVMILKKYGLWETETNESEA